MLSLLLLAAHMLGDYVLQNDWQARNKIGWKPINVQARTLHVTLYTLPLVLIGWLYGLVGGNLFVFAWTIFVTHWITDIRRWASDKGWCAKPILVDQTIHIVTLAIIGYVFFEKGGL